MKRLISLLFAFALLNAACGSPSHPEAPLAHVAAAAAGDLNVELLTDTTLGTGLTPVYLKVTDAAGAAVTDATVTFEPLMVMSPTMSHSCPVLGAAAHTGGGIYRTQAVFQMAGSWTATVTVTRGAAAARTANFDALPVVNTGRAKTFASGMSKFVVSLAFVKGPLIGLNPVVVTVHETADMGMTFTPVNDATIAMDPQMPSMGHGSTGNVNPAHVADGWYEGTLSFTMTGTWETTLTLTRPGVDPFGTVVITTTF